MTRFGFVKAATGQFDMSIGNPRKNKDNIIDLMTKAAKDKVSLLVFPELCLTGYSAQDMFLRKDLTDLAMDILFDIAEETADLNLITVLGLPVRVNSKLYNCAAYVSNGEVIAIIPKTYIPNYNEFYEKRWFASALDANVDHITVHDKEIPFGTNIIIEKDVMKIACEICEDLWINNPPSSRHTENGANIIVNLSASNDIATKQAYRKELVSMQASKCNCIYVYASCGSGESTSDIVYSGHQIICESGSVKAESHDDFIFENKLTEAVVDAEKVENDQIRMNSYRTHEHNDYRYIHVEGEPEDVFPSYMNPYPFIPYDKKKREERCNEILHLQAIGLATRLRKTGLKKAVIGVSGGLDSTLALLVIKEAYDLLHYPYEDIIGLTMPGFGTTTETKSDAVQLMEYIGITHATVDITAACRQHMKDIGQPEDRYDVTFENIQARERTQILMDVANKENGLVIGTGDLSETALGWCTFNGDHMSMYAVNTSVPKTLVRFIIETIAETRGNEEMHDVLIRICERTISPELLPPDENGNIAQDTEKSIGKYDLHDFFLYHYIRNAFSKDKILALAKIAFKGIAEDKQIEETLNTFIRRFRQNQFKRNSMPDGPKVGTVALSPRGDWRMPADYSGLD